MKFKMSYGLKIGCLHCFLAFSCFSIVNTAIQKWPSSTFDLPVYGIYHNTVPSPTGKTDHSSNDVYWDNLAKAFKQNPQAIINGVIKSKERLDANRHMFRDQYGRQFFLDPRFGAIPVVQQHPEHVVEAIPILVYDAAMGYIPRNRNKRFKLLIPQEGYILQRRHIGIKHGGQIDCDPNMAPMLSFDDGGENIDPCTGKSKNKAEFGLTATSGMADILCMFCQHIKNMQCIWQFCSHPEGVYKIKVSDSNS